MSRVGERRRDLEIAAEEVARMRAFVRAIAEVAVIKEGQGGREREKLADIRSLAADAFDLSAPVPYRVEALWREDQP